MDDQITVRLPAPLAVILSNGTVLTVPRSEFESLANSSRQRVSGEWRLTERQPWLDYSVMNDHIVRITGHVQADRWTASGSSGEVATARL